MSKRTAAIADMELEGPSLAVIATRQGKRPGRLSLDRMRPNPDQPRQHFDPMTVLQLAADITKEGLLQPILVGPPDELGIHTIIAGERRWRACNKADLQVADVIIDYDRADPQAMFDAALSENIHRDDLTRPELARALRKVKDGLGITDQRIADRYNKSLEWVRQVLAFAELPEPAQNFMEEHRIPTALAKAIRPLDPEHQLAVLRAVEPLEGRDVQLEHVGEVKDLVRQGLPVPGALDEIVRRRSPRSDQSERPRPSRLTRPFEWQPAGELMFLRVNLVALAHHRLTRTRSAPYDSWLEALVEDVTALRDTCAEEDAGGEEWGKFRAAVSRLIEDRPAG